MNAGLAHATPSPGRSSPGSGTMRCASGHRPSSRESDADDPEHAVHALRPSCPAPDRPSCPDRPCLPDRPERGFGLPRAGRLRRHGAPPGTTILEASAGTGKTWTIAALVARYVAEGTRLDRMLVVTFGRAASQNSASRCASGSYGSSISPTPAATAGRPSEAALVADCS